MISVRMRLKRRKLKLKKQFIKVEERREYTSASQRIGGHVVNIKQETVNPNWFDLILKIKK